MHFMTLVYGEDPEGQLEPYSLDNDNFYLQPIKDIQRKLGNLKREEVIGYLAGFTKKRSVVVVVEEDSVYERDGKLTHPYISDFCNFPCVVVTANTEGDLKLMSHVDTNGRWDWYQLGGRWSDHFMPKVDIENTYTPSIMYNYRRILSNQDSKESGEMHYYPSLRKRDIDVDRLMYSEAATANVNFFLEAKRVINDIPFKKLSELVDHFETLSVDSSYQSARTSFLEQEAIVRLKEELKDSFDPIRIIFDAYFTVDLLSLPVEEIERYIRESYLLGTSSLRNGQWVGDLFSFEGEDNQLKIHRDKMQHWKEAKEDEWVTVVDCHC